MKRKWLSMLLALALVFSLAPAMALAGDLPVGVDDDSFGTNTVYYNRNYYPTLVDALTAVYTSSPKDTAIIYCKPGADVGTMTHGHVADNITIYGNGAYVSGGEKDLEIDTYGYDRDTGERSDSDESLTKDITVEVHDLNGIAAWGERNTGHTINLKFYNCKNMNRVYFTNTKNSNGVINIMLDDCSFDGDQGSNQGTTVYSNSPGKISITNTTFDNISVGLNLNNKSSGTQIISVEGCKFTDCAIDSLLTHDATKTYSAPIRIVAKEGAISNLTVTNTTFHYTLGSAPQNGDILLNDGRHDAAETQGTVTLAMTGTAANIMVQKKGYYTNANGEVINADNGKTTPVTTNDPVAQHFAASPERERACGEPGHLQRGSQRRAAKLSVAGGSPGWQGVCVHFRGNGGDPHRGPGDRGGKRLSIPLRRHPVWGHHV